MDQATKSDIKEMVLALRQVLEADVETVLRRYGIFTHRNWLPMERLPEDIRLRDKRNELAAIIDVETVRGISRQEAAGWYVREVAFTFLNRLVGLKCLEVRSLFPETITTRPEYGGRSLWHRDYRYDHPNQAQEADDALPEALRAAFDKVDNEMIRVLFDTRSESSAVWPRHRALREAIALINGLPVEVWREDEIIGWIYQFYNTREKDEIRSQGRPELPIEVAIINQFFTPRWIVKFLVDNTLGRLWLEMHPDSARVRAKCDYLVPEPLLVGEEGGEQGDFSLDPDSPVNNSEAPARREPKPPAVLRLIDPACGTMHFGYYAFEVFQEIYRDARECGWPTWEDSGRPAPTDVEIPSLILVRNLYGVDIDLRAVQLAALSLYMKARVAEWEADPAGERVPGTYRVNLVCADARLTNGELRKRFLESYADDPSLQEVWKKLFAEMEDVAQVGSLLRVEERLRELLAAYKPPSLEEEKWVDQEIEVKMHPRQLTLKEASGGEYWTSRRTVAQMLNHLREFARDALLESDVNAQLFAVEVEKTLTLLDVLLQKYEVVVMNPPYGGTTEVAKSYVKAAYPLTKNDLYAAFFSRALDLLVMSGFVGALTSRTFLHLTKFQKLREEIILRRTIPRVLLDLGFDVLDDAMVETVASVLENNHTEGNQALVVFDVTKEETKQKQLVMEADRLRSHKCSGSTFVVSPASFGLVPESPFAYWASHNLKCFFEELPPLNPTYADVRQGLTTANDPRFVRQRWEVREATVGPRKKWALFAKGGSYSKYYYDIDLVVHWNGDGRAIKDYVVDRYPYLKGKYEWVVKNEDYYFTEGLTWPRVTVKGLNVRHLPNEAIFADKGSAILPNQKDSLWFGLGFLNSALAQAFLLMLTPSRSFEIGHLSAIPFREPCDEIAEQVANLAKQMFDLKAQWDLGNEVSSRFLQPWPLLRPDLRAGRLRLATQVDESETVSRTPKSHDRTGTACLGDILDALIEAEITFDRQLHQAQLDIDEVIYNLYQVSTQDRQLIGRVLGDRPPELVWPQMEGKSRNEKRRELVRRLLSYFILVSVKADVDGIVPFFPGTGEDTLLQRLRAQLAAECGEEAAFQMEDDAGDVMGRAVDNWLDGQFIRWHTRLYNKRPILWHIASPRNTFAVLLYYHKLDRDTLRKVRNVYLRWAREAALRVLSQAREAGDEAEVSHQEELLDDYQILDERLERVITGATGYRPPTWAAGPYRDGVYDPVIDDGVKVNLMPLQMGEVLRYKTMV